MLVGKQLLIFLRSCGLQLLFPLGLHTTWIWKQQAPLRRRYLFTNGNDVDIHETWKCTNTTVRTSHLAPLFDTFYVSDILQYQSFALNWHNWVAYFLSLSFAMQSSKYYALKHKAAFNTQYVKFTADSGDHTSEELGPENRSLC